MMQPSVPDTSTICRVCMTMAKGEGRTIDLVDLYALSPSVPEQISLHEMLKAICAPVFDKPAPDAMPSNACTGCRNDIIAAFRLHQQCIETDLLLGELLAVKQEKQDDEDMKLDVSGDPLMSCERQEVIKVEVLDLLDKVDDGDSCSEESDSKEEGAKCSVCGESFEDISELSVHIKDEHRLYRCKECGELCKSEHSLAYHVVKHKEKVISTCSDCGKQFATVHTMQRHKRDGFCPGRAGKLDPSLRCGPCNKTFETIGALQYHKTKHNGPTVCAGCHKSFASPSSLKIHTKSGVCSGVKEDEQPSTSGVGLVLKCDICDTLFKTEKALKEHRHKHATPSVCPGCDKTFATKLSLAGHLRKGTCPAGEEQSKQITDGPFFCDQCGKQFAKQTSLQVHINHGFCEKSEASALARTCKVCNVEQKTMYKLNIHMTETHPETLFICDICGVGSPSQKGLEKHKKIHVDGKVAFTCSICKQEFPTKRMMRSHRVSHAGPLKCNVCDRVVFSKGALRSHMLRHTGERNFACEHCPMRFFTQVEKSQHLVTHTKERNWICDTCGSRFTKKTSLKIHIREIHEGRRDHSCPLCNYVCAKTSQLKRHRLTHTGEKPFKCTYCEQAYAQSNDLTKHVARVHADGKAYPCDRCDESFRLLTELRQHYRVHVQAGEDDPQGGPVKFTTMAVLSRRLDVERKQQQQQQQQMEEGNSS